MFNIGLGIQFLQQRFRVFEKDKQLINENKEKEQFAKVDQQINLKKMFNRAPDDAVSSWSSKSPIHAQVAQSVKEAGAGIGGDRMLSAKS